MGSPGLSVRDKMEKNMLKNAKIHHTKLVFLPILALIIVVNTADAQVVCDKFKIDARLTGSALNFSLDTDLPDDTVVMVSVTRSYSRKGETDTYSLNYFSEKGTVTTWKLLHIITIDNDKWKSELRDAQEEMSRLGHGFDVASVCEQITVRIVAPINQPDPLFGKQNSKLTGKAVRVPITGLRIVEDEIDIDYPMDAPPVGKSPFPNLDLLNLEIGQIYIVSRQTPLLSSHSSADRIAALQSMIPIPVGGGFKVLGTFDNKGTKWYKVNAFNQGMDQVGSGWINSGALLGQQLKAYK